MKKITTFLLLLCAALFGATTASAETIKLTTSNGLPGQQLSNGQYTFESDALTAKTPFKYMRLTFFDTYGHNTVADNFKFVCLSEFYLEDANGTEIPLTVDNFSTNAQQSGEGPMANICDDNTASSNYWHSSWSNSVGEYHYLQIALPESMDPISTYKLKWITRNQNNSPISLAVTTAATTEELTNEVKNWQYTDDNGHIIKLLQSGAGLPGTLASGQYSWSSDLISYNSPVQYLIFRVIGTNTGANWNSYPFFTLSEFKVYDENGKQVTLTADNLSCNAIQTNDGGQLAAVIDNNKTTYLHTAYNNNSTGDPGTYHYLKVKLPSAMSKLKIAFDSRNDRNVPKCVELEAYADATAEGYTAIEAGTYRIVSAKTAWINTKKGITGSLDNKAINAGWEGVDVNDVEQYWIVAGNETNGYTIQNYGDKKYLTTGTGQSQASSLTDEGTKYKFYYLGDGQYNIYPDDSTIPLHCANQADGWAASKLTTWTGGYNSPSAWTLVKTETSVAENAAHSSLNAALSGVSTSASVADNAIGTNPGQIKTTMSLDELKAAVTTRNEAAATATTAAAGTDIDAICTAYVSLVNAKAAVPAANAIEANKYYRLKGGASSTYAVAGNTGQMNMAALSDDNKAATIFYLDDNKLLSYSNGYYVYQTREIGALGNSCTWTFSPSTSKLGTMVLQAGGTTGNVGTWMYDNFTKVGKVDRNGQLANDNTNWYIEPVDELPVNVSAARYATIYAPVALSIPTGVEAYAAEFTDGKVMLSPIEGTIPANTGVVIEGNEGTHNFTITTTDATVTSALSGNKATATVADDATAYILAKGAQGVGFYKLNSTDRTIQGGRAFYTVPASTENAVAFIFGGEVTDINNTAIADAQSNAPIYDLTGRKVAKAVKGGLYIQNGRKFIVK